MSSSNNHITENTHIDEEVRMNIEATKFGKCPTCGTKTQSAKRSARRGRRSPASGRSAAGTSASSRLGLRAARLGVLENDHRHDQQQQHRYSHRRGHRCDGSAIFGGVSCYQKGPGFELFVKIFDPAIVSFFASHIFLASSGCFP